MIDVSMLDSVLTTMGWVVSNYLIGGIQPAQHGNENTTSAPLNLSDSRWAAEYCRK